MKNASDYAEERKRLRAEMGDELYKQYFPNDSALEDTEEQSWKACEESYKKIKEMKQPSWKRKNTDTTDWTI
jgi:hypothetical protein